MKVAAWLRHCGIPADLLEGGALAWAEAGLPMVPETKLPPRNLQGLLLSIAAVIAMFRFKVAMIPTLAACSATGLILYLVGAIS